MISLLHPTMALFAVHSLFAAGFFNRLNLVRKIPKLTSSRFIWMVDWISSKVLNVVSVYAFISLMTFYDKKITFG